MHADPDRIERNTSRRLSESHLRRRSDDPVGIGVHSSGVGYDAISIRIAEDLGFEVGMFGGSWLRSRARRSDIALITLTELAEQMRRMSRAPRCGIGRCRPRLWQCVNVRRTVQELETAGAAGLTIEDTLLPQAFGADDRNHFARGGCRQDESRARTRRTDPALVIMGGPNPGRRPVGFKP